MVEIILTEYITYIKTFEQLIRDKYQLFKEETILSGVENSFKRKGNIDNFTYWFHGSGCSLGIDTVECHYDYFIHGIKFTLWAFKTFISTHPEYKVLLYTDKFLEIELYRLIERKILYWNTEDYVVYQVYHYQLN